MSPDFIFDYGILSTYSNKAEASQSAGRLKGNIKGWANYKPPTVFTTEKFDAVATSVEDSTRRLAGLAFDRHEAGESTVITNSEFRTMTNETDDLPASKKSVVNPNSFRKYTDMKQVRDAAKLMGYTRGCRLPKKNENGFHETSLNSKKRVVSVEEAINKVSSAYGTNNGVKTWRTFYPCYEDTKDSSTLRFIFIIRPSADDAGNLAKLDSQISSSPN
jgi:hypothetical protein